MQVTNYHTVDEMIIGESTGTSRTDYFGDALGSTTTTANSSAVVQNTYRYKPYGSTLAKTGTATDPKFQWVGGLGYRVKGCTHAEEYVRARTVSVTDATWTSVDPLWPNFPAYSYAGGNPLNAVDPSGLRTSVSGPMQGTINAGPPSYCPGAIPKPSDHGWEVFVRRTSKPRNGRSNLQ